MPFPATSSPSASASPWRLRVIVLGLLLMFVGLAGRLVQLQWWGREQFSQRAVRQRNFDETLPARPGDILDRDGRVLATSIPTQSLFVDPSEIDDPWEFAWRLTEAIPLDAPSLAGRIQAHGDKRFLWVKRRLTEAETQAVRSLKLPVATFGLRTEFLRRYPQGSVAAHVLGQRDIDGIGRGGIEERFVSQLGGADGVRHLVRDARGFVIEVRGERTARAGDTLRLSLDTILQMETEQRLDVLMKELQPESACAVVLDPRTGAVLAMASRPAFDPNDPAAASPSSWRNLAIQAMYEPGSTYKPLVAAYAIDREAIGREETFDCERGAYRMGPRVLHDHHRYGTLSVDDILVKSSNIGMAKIGERLTNAGLFDCAVRFGFGRPTGIELPGELPGMLHPLPKWTRYSTGSIPMGQEVSATPLQMLAAHAALANGGTLLTPHLVLDIHPAGVRTGGPMPRSIVSTRVIGEDASRWMVETPLVGVVQRGTGKKAQIEGIAVFGKSGTSQKVEANGTYSHSRHVASFICGAPANDPGVVVLVTVDEPTKGPSDFGGIAAAPAARDILERALQRIKAPGSSSMDRIAERPELP